MAKEGEKSSSYIGIIYHDFFQASLENIPIYNSKMISS